MKTIESILLVSLSLTTFGCKFKSSPVEAATNASSDIVVTNDEAAQMKIETALVDLQAVNDSILTSGKVTYDDDKVIHVYSPVSGKATKVFAQLGTHVKKGQTLVQIESPDIGSATSDVGKAKADLIAAEHDFLRKKELLEQHAVAPSDVEQSADNYRKAKAEMERAEQRAALFSHGDVVGQTYSLRSDIDGEVFMKAVSQGMELAGQYGGTAIELFTIGEADKVWVMADLYELDVRRVKVGAKVNVLVSSWPDRHFEGTVDWISAALDPNTHATKVRCTFDNADRALKPEMFVTAEIFVDEKKALAIPRSSILRLGEQLVVYLDRGQDKENKRHFERLPVSVDEGTGNKWVTVDRGLAQGDRVVVEGAILLAAKEST